MESKKYNKVMNITKKKQTHRYKEQTSGWDFPGGAVVKNLPANAGDMGSIPGPGRSRMPWSN